MNSKSYCQKKLLADFRNRVEYVVKILLPIYRNQGTNKIIFFFKRYTSKTFNIIWKKVESVIKWDLRTFWLFLIKLQNLPSRTTDFILLLSLKGLKLTKIHEIISFNQTNFAEKFIKTTTKLRAGTSSKILKSMWKFFNNVLFVSIKIPRITFLTGKYLHQKFFFRGKACKMPLRISMWTLCGMVKKQTPKSEVQNFEVARY